AEGAGRRVRVRLERDTPRHLDESRGLELRLEGRDVGSRAGEDHPAGTVLLGELPELGADALVAPRDPVGGALLVGARRRPAALRLTRPERAVRRVGAPERLVPRLLDLLELLDVTWSDHEHPHAVTDELEHQVGPPPQEVEVEGREERFAVAGQRAVVTRD